MNIGIVVYSRTGNTKSVAEKLLEKLNEEGHTANLEEIAVDGEVTPGTKEVSFKEKPEIDQYDAVIFAAPVNAFSLALPMKAYLQQLGPFNEKRTACFITKQLPMKWTGGNHAVRQIKKLCGAKGGKFLGGEIVIWSSKDKDQMIQNTVEALPKLF